MSNNLRFRVRSPDGTQQVLDPLPSSSTMRDLQSCIISKLNLSNVKPECVQLKFVFPPAQVISQVQPNTTLESLKLTSGNLIVSILDTPPILLGEADKKKKVTKEEEKTSTTVNKQVAVAEGSMVVKVIESDNSCLFNAVLHVSEEGTEDKGKGIELREIIASIVMSDPDQYSAALLGTSNEGYVEYIMKSDTWGGSIELSILSTYYELQINAIDVVTLNVHKFGENKNYKQSVYIIYDGIHYDALVMKYDNGKVDYRFGTTNDSVFAQALSIAAELNSKKQFTDVYNFGLICNVCQTLLKGQNEAQKHAEQTGHANFSQYK